MSIMLGAPCMGANYKAVENRTEIVRKVESETPRFNIVVAQNMSRDCDDLDDFDAEVYDFMLSVFEAKDSGHFTVMNTASK